MSLKTVAQHAGVGLSTASYALQNNPKIPAATRERVRQAAKKLGYRTNATVSRLMAELRTQRGEGSALAWIDCNPEPQIYVKVPWLRGWLKGARDCAEARGYRLDEFWLGEEGMSAPRLLKILTTRAVAGLVLAPTRSTAGEVPLAIEGFPAVSMAATFTTPLMHQATSDNFANTLTALEEMTKLGYRRIGFYSDQLAREWTEREQVGAFLEWQNAVPGRVRVPPLLVPESEPAAARIFADWLDRHRLDAILTTSKWPRDVLARLRRKVPREIGLAHTNLAEDVAGWSGIDPRIEEIAAAAVDLLIGQIHRHETGSPLVQKITSIRGLWVAGKTLRAQNSRGGPNE